MKYIKLYEDFQEELELMEPEIEVEARSPVAIEGWNIY